MNDQELVRFLRPTPPFLPITLRCKTALAICHNRTHSLRLPRYGYGYGYEGSRIGIGKLLLGIRAFYLGCQPFFREAARARRCPTEESADFSRRRSQPPVASPATLSLSHVDLGSFGFSDSCLPSSFLFSFLPPLRLSSSYGRYIRSLCAGLVSRSQRWPSSREFGTGLASLAFGCGPIVSLARLRHTTTHGLASNRVCPSPPRSRGPMLQIY
jgi:hypothetical protein